MDEVIPCYRIDDVVDEVPEAGEDYEEVVYAEESCSPDQWLWSLI
jgi:hypothetical protein